MLPQQAATPTLPRLRGRRLLEAVAIVRWRLARSEGDRQDKLPPPQAGDGRGGGSWRWLIAATFALMGLTGGYFLLPMPSLHRSQLLSTLVLARDGSILRGFLPADGKWRLPTAADQVDPLYRRMLIAAEDQRFETHFGVDPLAVARAVGQWIGHGHVVSGASTLTMQAVRLLERRPRTLGSKLAESGEAAPRLARMSSTTFDAQLDVASRVAQESPELYYEIQSLNDYGAESLEALSQAVERLRTAVLTQDHQTFVALMRRGRDYLEDRRSVAERRA